MHLRYSLPTGPAATPTPSHCTLRVTTCVCTTGAQAAVLIMCTILHFTALPDLHCKVVGCMQSASWYFTLHEVRITANTCMLVLHHNPAGLSGNHHLLHICSWAVVLSLFFPLCLECRSGCVQVLPSDRPWIIAHGGASGPLPGNTLPAFQRAIAVGANFITCEVVVTKDQQVCVLLFEFFWITCVRSGRTELSSNKVGSQSMMCKAV